MNKIKNLKWIGVFSLIATLSYGQTYTSQTVDFGITPHSMVGVDANSLTFSFGSVNAAGGGFQASSTASATTKLYYSYMPTNSGNSSKKIKVQFQGIPQGLAVALTVDNSNLPTGQTSTYGTFGTVATGYETTGSGGAVGSSPATIINISGASYTDQAFYLLSYTASITNYSLLQQTINNGANQPTISYTITN
jgi:hypothetical protein